jgi:hypothetical protein
MWKWDWGRTVSFLGVHKSDYLCSVGDIFKRGKRYLAVYFPLGLYLSCSHRIWWHNTEHWYCLLFLGTYFSRVNWIQKPLVYVENLTKFVNKIYISRQHQFVTYLFYLFRHENCILYSSLRQFLTTWWFRRTVWWWGRINIPLLNRGFWIFVTMFLLCSWLKSVLLPYFS